MRRRRFHFRRKGQEVLDCRVKVKSRELGHATWDTEAAELDQRFGTKKALPS